MTIRLETRTDFKRAGRDMATEAVAALAAHFETLSIEQLEDGPYIDHLATVALDAMERTAESYRQIGVPGLWIEKFRSAFRRTAGEQLRALSFRSQPVAGNA